MFHHFVRILSEPFLFLLVFLSLLFFFFFLFLQMHADCSSEIIILDLGSPIWSWLKFRRNISLTKCRAIKFQSQKMSKTSNLGLFEKPID